MSERKIPHVDAQAKVTSKGQVTIPKSVRDALGVKPGDNLHFAVRDGRAELTRLMTLDELAGSVPVPPDVQGLSWEEIRRRAREAQARKFR